MKMNADVKAKWLEALRSGKYEQAHGQLRTETGFCCLGVLCELERPGDYERDYGYPDDNLLEEVKLPVEQAEYLANFNDNGKSFIEIAEYIEQNL